MYRKIISAVFGLIAILTIGFFIVGFDDKINDRGFATKKNLNDVIITQHTEIDRLAAINPNSNQSVYISFKTFFPANEVKELSQRYNLEIVEVYHGWEDYKGGAIVTNNSFDEDIKWLEKGMKESRKKFIQSFEKTLNNSGESSDRRSIYENALRKEKAFLDDLETFGIKLYGLQAKGKARDLKNLKDQNQNLIRSIHFTDSGIFPGAISPVETLE